MASAFAQLDGQADVPGTAATMPLPQLQPLLCTQADALTPEEVRRTTIIVRVATQGTATLHSTREQRCLYASLQCHFLISLFAPLQWQAFLSTLKSADRLRRWAGQRERRS